ncbi:hypothetical protein D8674_026492 [Pyrus ussuriensis x Pyrus communis]|uniref:Uncharacterized protein n=1 Tax=Pyrus ussuriensis x Pyrus communis TaxID=2448454 RepID=A0A5N5I830_9ROSA|nr:hypothetical protein D8674_026492 [Pyrus ussuriensis x Pyrus communis]
MADKNKDKSVRDANPHDLREHFEFAHAIAVAMGNNCPIVEWRSWEDVPGNVKRIVMDKLLYTIDDDTNKQLMKLMDDALEGGYNQWCYERYRGKQVPYFEGKNMVEAYAEFRYDIGNLVRRDCFAEFESWKKVSEELKKSMLGKLLLLIYCYWH